MLAQRSPAMGNLFTSANALGAVNTGAAILSAFQQARTGASQAHSYAAAAGDDYEALSARSREVMQSTRDQIGIRAAQAERELGRLNAVLADSGLVGSSARRLRAEIAFNRDTDNATTRASASNQISQVKRDMRAVSNTYKSRVNSIDKPSGLGLGLSTAAGLARLDLWGKTGDTGAAGAAGVAGGTKRKEE